MQIERKYPVGFDSEWDVEAVRALVRRARHAVLVAHTNADGDAVGSLTGMTALLTAAGLSEATPLLPDGVPEELAWLPNTDRIVSAKDSPDRCREAIADADLIVGLDISSFGRTGMLEPWLRASQAKKLLVDHHECPDREAFDTVVSEPDASSTCELVYWLMRAAFGDGLFGKEAAESLFTGICTDTGTFSYSNDRPSVYLAAADLLHFGIDPMHINRCIKNVFTEARLRFFGFAVAHRLTVYERQRVALMVLSADDISQGGVQSSELTGLINEVMRLRDVDCGILVREEEGKVRLSLRSKELYDVNQLAREMFDGGGHKRAAGATSLRTLDETVEIVKKKLGLTGNQ
ncbi:MAG: DHH family phosphoesterase [Bacteroidales bacterium]|nr:DHH family phosphoesterase [Bacteroidales bacterium]